MTHEFKNEDILQANEQVVFIEAFDPDCVSNCYSLDLEADVHAIRCCFVNVLNQHMKSL
jgi:hypothetical protein